MYENVVECPICNGHDFSNYLISKDYSISGENFAISKCNNCSLLLTNPRPIEKEINKFYESDDYISHTNKATNLTNFIYKIARKFTFHSKLKLLNRLSRDKSILDYGCGTGMFLQECQNTKWKIDGIEPDLNARNLAEKNTQHKIHSSIQEIAKNNHYDIITLWHVLEHVYDFNKLLDKLNKLLQPKGHLIIAVPNPQSYDASYYKEYWAAYDLPRHIYHFNQLNINDLMKYHHMKVIETIPMKLDAYYVSLLSEKYKNDSNNYLNSIINGYKSNSWAKKNNNNYSSLIYIIKKK